MKSRLFFSLLLVILLTGSILPLQAAYLHNMPVQIEQPDGTVLTVFATGDEFYHRYHDANNYTITRDPVSGFYVYADLSGDMLIPTNLIVGQDDPMLSNLSPGLSISAEKQHQLRKAFLEGTPKKPALDVSPAGPLTMGTINNLVVYIRFSDQTDFTTQSGVYTAMFNSTSPGANSMYNYFREASFENLSITSFFYPAPAGPAIVSYQDSHTRSYYMPYNATSNPDGYQPSERTAREHALLVNAVNAVSAAVPAGLDIDHDMDGYVDNVCFIIRGGTTAWSTLLWPHRWSLYSQTVYIQGKRVWDYNFQLEDFLNSSGNGVLCHEMFHTLGAPDLYHYNGDGNTPVGSWDIMESTTNPPQSMGAFMKHKYGSWISYIPPITVGGEYTLNPVTNPVSNCYKMFSAASSTEYFVFEYRNKDGTFESSIPASGLLIYRISTTVGDGNADGPPDEVYLYRPGGTVSSNGTINQGYFSSGSGRNKFTNTSNPNCFYADGSLANIEIVNITDAIGTISFTVNIGTVTNFVANKTETCPNSTVQFTDQSTGGPSTFIWTVTPATHVYVNGTSASSQNPQIQFTSPGLYSVSLLANGVGGPNVKIRNNYITVLAQQSPPVTDNFESGTFATNNITLKNPDNLTTWAVYNGVGGNTPGTQAAFMDFRDYSSTGAKDYLVLPPVNLSSYGSAQMTFKVAYRPYDASHHDSLRVLIYTQCGDQYVATPYAKTGTVLATGSATTTEFVPSQASHWRTETINLNPYIGQVVLIKFEAVNGNGNNLYLDDISVIGSAPISANFTASSTSICSNSTVSFTDQSSGSPTSWFWNFGDGSSSNQQNPTHQYTLPGTYSVTLTIYKSTLSNSIVKTGYIQVNPQVFSSIFIEQIPPGAQCPGTPLTFSASITNGGANPVFQWKRNNINVGTNSPVYSAANFSTGEIIRCVLSSDAACVINPTVNSSTLSIQISQSLTPSVSITSDHPGTICAGSTVEFTAIAINGGLNPQFIWRKNGTQVGTNSDHYTDNALADGDSVCCTLISDLGCLTASTAYSPYLVMDVIPGQTASINLTCNVSGPVCTGDPVTFTASIQNGGNQPAFQWKKNGQNDGTNSSTYTTNSLLDGDLITCTLTSNLQCTSNNPVISDPLVMQVNPKLPLSVIIESNPPMPVCQGTSVSFSAQTNNAGSNPSYVWKRNGVPVGFNPTYTPANLSNNQIITCVVTSSETCISNSPATSNSITTVVNPSQPLSVSITANPGNTICPGTEVSFTAAVNYPGTQPAFEWKVNNVTVSTDPVFVTSSLYHGNQVKCVVTSNAPCILPLTATSNTITMSVMPEYAVSVTITADPPGVVCTGTPVIYLAYPENGGNNPLITWYKNEEVVSTGFVYVADVLNNGDEISCILESGLSGCLYGNPATASLIAEVQVPPAIYLGNDTIIPSGETLTLSPGTQFSEYLWSTGATTATIAVTQTGTYSVTVSDVYGCSANDEIHVTVGYGSLEGNLSYFNTGSSSLSNVVVQLMQGSEVVESCVTDAGGHYAFDHLLPATYSLQFNTTRPWGGVNSSDALLALKHFVGISLLSGLKITAGDVNGSGQINSQDALYIQRRYINQITSFPVPDWIFEHPAIVVPSSVNTVQHTKALCAGDVNGSYSVPLREERGIELVAGEFPGTVRGDLVTIPILPLTDLKFSALSLSISFDPSFIPGEISTDHADSEHFMYTIGEGIIRISWISLSEIEVKAGTPLFSITGHYTGTEENTLKIILHAMSSSEFADLNGVSLPPVSLLYPSDIPLAGHIVQEAGHFPNPVSGRCTFWVNLDDEGPISLKIYSLSGDLVSSFPVIEGHRGLNTWSVDAGGPSGLPATGVYSYILESGGKQWQRKLVLVR